MKLMTFLSDFGYKSSYVAQMKGVAYNITDATLLDITHNIKPHDIREGAFVLKTAVDSFPKGTVNVAVVDPGVGTKRRGIVVTTESQIFVGPDNGLLIPAAGQLGNFRVYEIQNTKLMLNNISNTFHGRDIFTPVAAHILKGVYFEEIGPKINDYIDLDFGKPTKTMDKIIGKIIYIDDFGNIITNIRKEDMINQNVNKINTILKDKKIEIPYVESYGFVKKGQTLATIGSSTHFEISINQGDAAKKYNAKIGDQVEIMLNFLN